MKNCRRYITESKIFTSNNQTDTNANSVLFVNTGSVNVIIDGLTLQPSQSWAIDGNENELCIKVYTIQFAAGTNPQLTVIYKRYVN